MRRCFVFLILFFVFVLLFFLINNTWIGDLFVAAFTTTRSYVKPLGCFLASFQPREFLHFSAEYSQSSVLSSFPHEEGALPVPAIVLYAALELFLDSMHEISYIKMLPRAIKKKTRDDCPTHGQLIA